MSPTRGHRQRVRDARAFRQARLITVDVRMMHLMVELGIWRPPHGDQAHTREHFQVAMRRWYHNPEPRFGLRMVPPPVQHVPTERLVNTSSHG